MLQEANKKEQGQAEATGKGPLHDLFRKLPGRSEAVGLVVEALSGKGRQGGDFAQATIYNVIQGKSRNTLIAEAFVRIAGELIARGKAIEDEARKLAA